MAFFAYLAFCVVALLTLLLGVVFDDEQLGVTVLVVILVYAGLWRLVTWEHRRHHPG